MQACRRCTHGAPYVSVVNRERICIYIYNVYIYIYIYSVVVDHLYVWLLLDEKWLLDAKTWCAVALCPVLCVEQGVHYFGGTAA